MAVFVVPSVRIRQIRAFYDDCTAQGYAAREPVGNHDVNAAKQDGTTRVYDADNKADNIYYDEDGQYIQLVANGELIGDKVALPSGGEFGIVDCKITEDGHLVVTLSNGKIIDAGYVGAAEGVTFTPHISDDLILSWTNNGGLENPEPVDLNPFDEWVDDDEMSSGDYIWEDE